MLGNSFCEFGWYLRTNDLVPLFDPKVNLFENSPLRILAQLLSQTNSSIRFDYQFTKFNDFYSISPFFFLF